MRAGRRGDRVELTIGPGSSEAVSPRPSHHLPVPSLVDRAAPSGVVPGKPGGAAVLGAGSGFAEGAHHRSGAGGAASAIAHRHSHACIVPPPKQGKRCSASPYPAGRGRCGRIGSVAACRVLLWCGAGCGGWAGLAGRGPKGSAPPGQVAGCRVPPRARAQRGRRSGPCGRLAVTELLARVGGSSVTANWPCADQGGRHVDVVVGADHRGRAGVGVWRDAASRPLTALRQRPDHGRRSCWTRPTAWRRGRWVHTLAGAADHPALLGPPGSGVQPGLGPVALGHREQFFAGKATPFGLVHDGDGGLSVGLSGGGGHHQPQPSCGSWDRGDARLAAAGTTGSAQARHRLIR